MALDESRALRRAATHARRLGWPHRPRTACRWAEARGGMNIYTTTPIPEQAWVVAFAPEPARIASTRIVILDAATGGVLYAGDAGDEG